MSGPVKRASQPRTGYAVNSRGGGDGRRLRDETQVYIKTAAPMRRGHGHLIETGPAAAPFLVND